MRRNRQAKIIATLGPASSTSEVIEELFIKGVDVFRLNFSHGTHEEHKNRVEHIRALEEKYQTYPCILADLQGPKIRIGLIDGIHNLEKDQVYVLDQDPTPGNNKRVSLPHPEIFDVLKPEDKLLINDGKIVLKITSKEEKALNTVVETGGEISSKKGVNIPGTLLPVQALTAKDKEDLAFALSLGVDWIGLSFVQTEDDVKELRALCQSRARIISKIEKPLAIEHLEAIVKESDAIMVARGDLGVELPLELVPAKQKQIMSVCKTYAKPVVIATQMLESMIHSSTPTRAEVNDVATAVYDGADGVMLSAESAFGNYPIESVSMMARIVQTSETQTMMPKIAYIDPLPQTSQTITSAISKAAKEVANAISIKVIAAFTASGSTATFISHERPMSPILALSSKIETVRQLGLYWGVQARLCPVVQTLEEATIVCKEIAEKNTFCLSCDRIMLTGGVPFGTSGTTNLLHVIEVD
ncbi:MAG TPA: pyruvate kinase [Alphaproteobacteria bacterium]|nr:pyruvate kinase [Alphaproteobacteria bacterium]